MAAIYSLTGPLAGLNPTDWRIHLLSGVKTGVCKGMSATVVPIPIQE